MKSRVAWSHFDYVKAALAGRYRLEREIGSGGMAMVYLARDLVHDRRVALKVLRAEWAAAIDAQRFLNEIQIMARLYHPHLVPLFASGDADGLPYYVMPHIEGESLRQRLDRERQLPLREALAIARTVARVLAYAHDQQVIHRDIKPENILLYRGEALVGDFGIALALQSARVTRLTPAGFSPGTPHYMSPEQVRGLAAVDGRSDAYSLACVLYEMIAGEPPFSGSCMRTILVRHLESTPPSLRVAKPSVPTGIVRAVGKALSKRPADRFQSLGQFAEALTLQPLGSWVGGGRLD